MADAMVATRERFVREFLYGDVATDVNTFDGLSKSLTGASTELTTATNWVTVATQVAALQELDKFNIWLSKIVPSNIGGATPGQPGGIPPGVKALLFNTVSFTQFVRLARWANMLTTTKDNFDQDIDTYRGYRLIDLGDRADGALPLIPIVANVTEVFAVSLGLDAVHAASVAGKQLVKTYMPDFTTAGAVKTGEVQIGPVTFVLRSTRAAGVYRNITVQ
jgi:hypothetical protein